MSFDIIRVVPETFVRGLPRTLFIDDEALAIEAIVSSLNRIGYHEILQAANAETALQIIDGFRPDVVLADICMPGMDGISLFSAAKKRLQGILFVFISGYDYFEYAREALALGAFNYLLKPVKEIRLTTGNKSVEVAKSYIQNNYTKEITAEMVAQYVNLSPSYLSTIFKKVFGMSIIEYITTLRISKAKELLKEGRYKAVEICQMVGFYDVKHFYKVFKKNTGYTPSEYRNLYSG